MSQIEQNKIILKNLLDKIEESELFNKLEEIGFFVCPASSKYHLNYKGGLLQHSLNVFKMMYKLKDIYKFNALDKDIILSSILHDVDKCYKYKEVRINETTVYHWNDKIQMENGIGSIFVANNILGLKLSKEVTIAIIYHMGFYQDRDFLKKFNTIKKDEYSFLLLKLLQIADESATFYLERDKCMGC